MHDLRLISLYYKVCDSYNTTLCYSVQRFSNNGDKGSITDQELITMYLFAHIYEAKYEKKQIYDYFVNHWLSWFPHLPSYQTFNDRINRLDDAFEAFLDHLIVENIPKEIMINVRQIILGDSMLLARENVVVKLLPIYVKRVTVLVKICGITESNSTFWLRINQELYLAPP